MDEGHLLNGDDVTCHSSFKKAVTYRQCDAVFGTNSCFSTWVSCIFLDSQEALTSGISLYCFCDLRILAWLGYALSSGCHEAAAKGLAGLPSHVVAWPGRDAPPGSSGCRHSGFPRRRGTAGLCRPGPGCQLLTTTAADFTNPARRVSAASLPTSPSRVKPRAKQTSLHLGPAGGLRREDCGGRTAEGGLRREDCESPAGMWHSDCNTFPCPREEQLRNFL
ncbi:unnamed protein product [Nyctereutes procyonoides]|uniref:(raccoon dog) hypothetical protein n=1 Tax=Nyctereutes procyonoides TaxID=34880 RepID=A0A811Y358_NYCPR|nr:unnamed protein product [Nyctereutes procyonoides]